MSNQNARDRSVESIAFAHYLREQRRTARLTQDELAERSGLPKHTILRIEKGYRVADITQVARLATGLGQELAEFMAGVQPVIESLRASLAATESGEAEDPGLPADLLALAAEANAPERALSDQRDPADE